MVPCGGAAAYYRGAMGIVLVYDITDEPSFNNIRNWIRNINEHASDRVNKVRPCVQHASTPGARRPARYCPLAGKHANACGLTGVASIAVWVSRS